MRDEGEAFVRLRASNSLHEANQYAKSVARQQFPDYFDDDKIALNLEYVEEGDGEYEGRNGCVTIAATDSEGRHWGVTGTEQKPKPKKVSKVERYKSNITASGAIGSPNVDAIAISNVYVVTRLESALWEVNTSTVATYASRNAADKFAKAHAMEVYFDYFDQV